MSKRLNPILFVAVLLCYANAGCSESTYAYAPDGWSRNISVARRDPLGAWSVVRLNNGSEIGGELLAVDTMGVYLGADPKVVYVAHNCVEKIFVADLEATTSGIVTWTTLGALSTISHGVFLSISFPIWAIAGASVTTHQTGVGHAYWDRASAFPIIAVTRYARFPQGIPPLFAKASREAVVEQPCANVARIQK
ncbi:MAG: hypothetical protein SGI86_12800 [Deltaproteobacteria bacterium]|nr:hypothetical protein [Deltaproteobacteria bacterium]